LIGDKKVSYSLLAGSSGINSRNDYSCAQTFIQVCDHPAMKTGSLLPFVGAMFDMIALTLLKIADSNLVKVQKRTDSNNELEKFLYEKEFSVDTQTVTELKLKGLNAQKWYSIKGAVLNTAGMAALVALSVLGFVNPAYVALVSSFLLAMTIYCIVNAVKQPSEIKQPQAQLAQSIE